MQSPAAWISLLVAVVALGVAGYAVSENRALRAELEAQAVLADTADGLDLEGGRVSVAERLLTVEAEVARLDDLTETGPALVGRTSPGPLPAPSATDRIDAPHTDEAAAGQLESMIGEAVEKAVDKKARKILARQNKKPSMDVFASVLELEDTQRASVEREVIAAQLDIRDVLTTPAADGTVFMDQVVDLAARGIANPGKDVGWGKFLARVMTETIPGSDDTFGARIETVKQRLRGAFERDMTEEQYADFEAWQMDPSEIADVPGSPFADLSERILERAKELGAQIPEGDD